MLRCLVHSPLSLMPGLTMKIYNAQDLMLIKNTVEIVSDPIVCLAFTGLDRNIKIPKYLSRVEFVPINWYSYAPQFTVDCLLSISLW